MPASGKASRSRVAVDVGGTFIDFVMLDEVSGELVIEKQPSTSSRLVEEFLAGLDRLPVQVAGIERIFHGTTVAINTILQERGVTVGLITTDGFRDVLSLARGGRPEIYNLFHRPTPALVPRDMRVQVRERVAGDGTVVQPLDEVGLLESADLLVRRGAAAIAICFLHSYANHEHERRAAELVRERYPEIAVTASSELVTEWREYERTSTTVLNSYVQPSFQRYISDLVANLGSRGYYRPVALMQSSGGVIAEHLAARKPIRTLESGPAGGVIGAAALAAQLGHRNVICADVGGTSYDVALIEDGRILERSETTVDGRPVLGPTIDIVSIGAGGGSIAWIDHRGALQVGPRSAGAHPGPAAFGLGGTEPTVTDAHLLLGRLDPQRFLGSRMRLDPDAATEAMRSRIAEPLGLSLEQAAAGTLAIAETSMTYAIRAVTVERGLDPRDFVMYSYGGGGGLFAAAVAEHCEVGTVVVPQAPANFSAWGILSSDYREDAVLTRVLPLDEPHSDEVIKIVSALAAEATDQLAQYGFTAESLVTTHQLDVRYTGQDATIPVALDVGWLESGELLRTQVRAAFVGAHRRLYGHGSAEAPLELVHSRARVVGPVTRPSWPCWTQRTETGPHDVRPVHFGSAFVETRIYEREALAAGQRVPGPAVIEEWTTTTVVPPGWTAGVDDLGNLIIERSGCEA
ncbi:hydantoinase/oxoprolinase family protein [Pseudonocardia kunmingensis]|uniref:N-methylhydantoinase A n=1 Tax=Pseudonocardia kunmingensis TaxID=630975 RepID=A0A543DQJ8_9PSEU|nr:hydantoinase/oxoprolinase family protein [Pseudonocardia kunmingensis]TQM11612.1 N-methylhydantoinase A [Pseudonocardia kunmingensis]